jgi:uncharacterized membrane protein
MASEQQQDAVRRKVDDAPITASKTAKPERELFAEAVTIARPAADLYAFWRDQPNLAQVMDNVVSIERLAEDRYRWTVKGPAGSTFSWTAAITEDEPGHHLTWQSTPDSEIANSGRIEFRDAGKRGTVVRATIAYDPPGGAPGKLIAKLFQREPRIQTRRDLYRFKQLMETGEIATAARNQRERTEQED